ncbi:MAG: SpoIIE family protein phosphatase [Candidatus Krumholzibacteria bacterium]|nr:SpoIIE family protein phosphatase [Candidatus Krumholzibacteria bacterium]
MRYLAVYRETTFERVTRLLGLYLLAPLLMTLTLPVTLHIAQKPDFGFSVRRMEVAEVVVAGPAEQAGLRKDDLILTVDGRATINMPTYYAALAGHHDLTPLPVKIMRGRAERMVIITPTTPRQAEMIRSYGVWVSGLAFLMIGFWVLLRRRDPVARNFFSLCFIFAFFLLDIPDHTSVAYMTAKEMIRYLFQLLLPAYFLRFFLQFPSPRSKLAREKKQLRLLLVPGWVLFGLFVWLFFLNPAPGGFPEYALGIISLLYLLGFFLTGLVIFARRVMRRDRPIQRTKLKVILLGLVCGLTPFFAALLLKNLSPGSSLPHFQFLAFSLLLVPVSFGLAILRYGALDTAFVVRTSLIYGLITLLVLLIYFVIVLGLGEFLAQVFQVETYRVLLVVMAGSSLAILPLRRWIQGMIDDAFYPARRANRRAMTRLADQLTGLIDPEEVIRTLVASLDDLFRPDGITLFLSTADGHGPFRPRMAGTVHDDFLLDQESGLAILLNRIRRPVFAEELEDHLFAGDTDAESLKVLTRINAALLVPMIAGNRLLGFLTFGPKSSGALYSQEDLANLRGLAVQAASLIESRQLYLESLRQKRMETELEVARDIQARLLPTGPLDTDLFSICGRNEPCRMVGGDYFDYFQFEDGTLGFAIADVSGKGIPAALMMTSLVVAFRREAKIGTGPRAVMDRLNPVVASLVSTGNFICLFFGIWNPATGIIHYCNAGMDPPVLFRPRVFFRQRLKKGGPVLGVETERLYREGTLALEPGDRLLLFTDGLTEEQNPLGDFFDLGRLLDLVAANIEFSPLRLIEKIFSAVNAFGGEEKSDDKTAIILEIKNLK